MAETNAGSLTTSLIIEDRASSVLKNIARSAEQARIALDSVNIAVAHANSAPRFNTSGISQNLNTPPQSRAPKAEIDVLTTAATDSLKAAQDAASASVSSISHAKGFASNIEKLSPYLSKAGQSLHLFLGRMNATFSALMKRIPVIEKAARSIARITDPFIGIFQSVQKRIPLIKSTLNRLGAELMQMGADGARSIQRGIASIKRTAEKFSALMNAGANLAGWGQILNSIKEGIARQFARADAMAMQMGRFRLIAEDEGTRGGDNIEARSRAIKSTNQGVSQALGMDTGAFADVTSSFFLQGNGTFKSMEQAQAFAASLKQNFDLAGTGAMEAQNAMIQLKQALGSGRLQGDELRSVMENAPNVGRLIESEYARRMGEDVSKYSGQIRNLAAEGLITSDIVRNAILNSAEATNDRWKKLPITWQKTFSRFNTLKENLTQSLYEGFGNLAGSEEIANLAMGVIRLLKNILDLASRVTPFFSKIIAGIGSVLIASIDGLNTLIENAWLGVPALTALGISFVAVAVNSGAAGTMVQKFNLAMKAISANPVLVILVAVLALSVAVAHLVRTTETGQAIMLQATAAISHGFIQAINYVQVLWQWLKIAFNYIQIGANAAEVTLTTALLSILRGVKTLESSILNSAVGKLLLDSDDNSSLIDGIISRVEAHKKAVEALNVENLQDINAANSAVREIEKAIDLESKNYENYVSQIDASAKKSVEENKRKLINMEALDGLLKGVSSDILTKAPGSKDNPARVTGKVQVDPESFDILKRAAGYEIVNRYTNLRPVVNAQFGDINEMNASDVLGALVTEMERAKGAALSEAQGASF